MWLAREDIPPHADAMVLLMGGFPDRVLQAVDQWHEERADRIINKAFKKSDMPVYVGFAEKVVLFCHHVDIQRNKLIT